MDRRLMMSVAAILGALALGTAASAQSVTGQVTLGGQVAPRCSFNSGNVTIDIGEMSDTSGDVNTAKYVQTSLESHTATLNGFCTGSGATMAVQAFPLVNTSFVGAPPSGFESKVNYTATATEGSVSASGVSTSSSAGTPSAVGAFSSDIVVSFSNSATPGGGRLIAGPYTGSVNVILTPSS